MKEKKHFTHAIQTKFLVLRIFIAAVIVAVSGVSIFFVQKISQDTSSIIENQVPLLQEVQEAHSEVLSTGLVSASLLNATDVHAQDGNQEKYAASFSQSLNNARTILEALAVRVGPDTDAGVRIAEIHSSIDSFETAFKEAYMVRLAAEAVEGSGADEEAALHGEALLLQDAALSKLQPISSSFDELETYLVTHVDSEVRSMHAEHQSTQVLVALISLLAVCITLLVGIIFSNRTIVKPLQELTRTAEEMASGKLSLRVDIPSRDEIGKLSYTFNKMAAKLETSYDSLEKVVEEKTEALEKVLEQFETKNEDLEKSQMATINLLEDLEEEKKAVEERVKIRTQELEREKNKLLQVTSNMRGGGILLDDAKEVVFVNDAAFSMLGIPKQTPINTVLGIFLSHFDGDAIKEHYKKCIEGNTFHVSEIDGNDRVYEIFFHHLSNATETTGYFILVFDITDAKLLERSKSELVAVASHQLRTPLTAMRGNVEMLIDESFGALNKEQHELLDDVEVSTIRLITMVNEMLDITKIERGDLEMKIEELNIQEVVSSVIGDLKAYAERHEFTVTESLPKSVFVKGDKVRLRQVFQNLVDNAIKYSNHPGTLDISAEVMGKRVEIAFKDNGIGVPKNEQSKLFERFYRASNTAKTASSGSGLGLYIVKSIANQLGGDIRFESQEHVGTTFFVTLPISATKV